MIRLLDTLDIDAFVHVWVRLKKFFSRAITPDLLADHAFLYLDSSELRRIRRKRRRCSLVGHMWEVERYDRPNATFHLKCSRCFPHIDSRRTVISYAPFVTVERKTD